MSKSLTTVALIFAVILAMPIMIGIAGGFFGVIMGLVGTAIGIVSGVFGAVIGAFGAVIGAFGAVVGALFGGGWNLLLVALVVVALVLIAKGR